MTGKRMNARTPIRWGWIAGLLAIVVLANACKKEGRLADARRDGVSNLLLITLDTTRADRIGVYGDTHASTPNLDRLAREGVRFDRAYTSAPLTLPAHVTLMTGREPPAHQVRNNGTYSLRPEENTLAEMLNKSGFSTQALIAAYVLERKFGLAQGFSDYDDGLGTQLRGANFHSEITADQVYAKFNRWLERSPASPFFCWVHFYDPHAPYQPPLSFKNRFPDDFYSGEIAFVDETIGRMLKDLDSRRLLEKTLLIVVGDHGEGFGEHGETEHGLFCYEETLRVPLIFHQPRLFPGGRVVTQPVGLVDVLPTVLELYRLPPPPGVQGRSFAHLLTSGKATGEPQAARYFESMYGQKEMGWAPLTGLLRGSFKYVSLPRPELYDLAADPQERDNIYLKKNALAKQLARELDVRLRQITQTGTTALRLRPTRQDQAHLRALGYLASTDADPRSGNGEDPKEGIVQLNQLKQVGSAILAKDLAGAGQLLAVLRASGINQRLPQFYDLSYELLRARNDPLAAERLLTEAISRFPDATRFPMLLASLYGNQGLADKAEEMARLVLAKDPQATEAHMLLGGIYRKRGLAAQAIDHFRRAAELEPRNQELAIDLAGLLAESGKPDQALAILRAQLKTGFNKDVQGKSEIRGQAAQLLVKLGEPGLAEDLLRELVREQGGNPAHWTQLGLVQLDRGQGEQAIQSFQQALRLDPRQALALSGLGTLHLTLFRQSKNHDYLRLAADSFAQALAADKKLITAVNGLGVVHLYRGEVPQAIEKLQEAIRLDPTFVNAYFNLAIAQLSIGRRIEARKTLNTLQKKLADRLSDAERGQLTALLRETGA
jgi:arylsulfatase A-like enzyme/Tfp pilus assembly protein PilF